MFSEIADVERGKIKMERVKEGEEKNKGKRDEGGTKCEEEGGWGRRE